MGVSVMMLQQLLAAQAANLDVPSNLYTVYSYPSTKPGLKETVPMHQAHNHGCAIYAFHTSATHGGSKQSVHNTPTCQKTSHVNN
jgi:hypothetical protein